MANSWNSLPTTSPMNSSGISTATSDTVSETRVKPIWRAPLSAASSGPSPSSMCRAMFSSITMASSTTKPVAMVSAIRVRLLSEKPASSITPKVATSDSGTAIEGMIVAGMVRRNTKVTSTTRPIASSSSCCTPLIEARIDSVRSLSTVTSTAAGIDARSCGSRAWMRSTTSITLAPGWRWMLTRIAGTSPDHAASWLFSAPCSTVATSPRRSGAPLFQASTRFRYSSAERIWSLASSMVARVGPSKLPLGMLTLAALIARRMSPMPSPAEASACGLTWMRTAGRCPPARLTRPTPGSCDRRWAMRVSTRS